MKSSINIIIFISCFFITTFNSYSAEISQAQIEQFKQLSPNQQQALAKSMGVDLSNLGEFTKSSETKQHFPSLNELVPTRAAPSEVNNSVQIERADDFSFSNGKENKNSIVSIDTVAADELQFTATPDVLELKPFGYSLFAGEPTTFAPVSDVPIPSDYVLGPGDTLSIQLYGKETASLSLTLNRQGNIDIPKLGPINVAGQSFSEAKNLISSIIQERKIGVKLVSQWGSYDQYVYLCLVKHTEPLLIH